MQGGHIVQGQSQGYGDTAIWAESVDGNFTLDSTQIQIAGMDAYGVDLYDAGYRTGGNVTMTNSQITMGLYTISNRMIG